MNGTQVAQVGSAEASLNREILIAVDVSTHMPSIADNIDAVQSAI